MQGTVDVLVSHKGGDMDAVQQQDNPIELPASGHRNRGVYSDYYDVTKCNSRSLRRAMEVLSPSIMHLLVPEWRTETFPRD